MRSATAKKVRIKVGLNGVVVVLPEGRDDRDASAFVNDRRAWVPEQVARINKLHGVRRPSTQSGGEILFRGRAAPLRIVRSQTWRGSNKVAFDRDTNMVTVTCKPHHETQPARSLESWLRKQARLTIGQHVADVGKPLRRTPNRIYVMDSAQSGGTARRWAICRSTGGL